MAVCKYCHYNHLIINFDGLLCSFRTRSLGTAILSRASPSLYLPILGGNIKLNSEFQVTNVHYIFWCSLFRWFYLYISAELCRLSGAGGKCGAILTFSSDLPFYLFFFFLFRPFPDSSDFPYLLISLVYACISFQICHLHPLLFCFFLQ